MKNINPILIAIIALAVGLAVGYFLFQGNSTADTAETQQTSDTAGEEQIWTCSMHPQIRQNEPGLCPICEMDLIPLESNLAQDPLVLEMTKEAVNLAQVQTTVIGSTGKAKKTFSLSGKIQADERTAASQVAHIPGRIEQLFVTFKGETVRKGQKLAILYSPELVTAQQELLEALKFQDVNPELVEAARKKLTYWKIPEEQIQAIEASGEVQETFTVFADASGVVTNRKVAVGDYVQRGEALFDIISLKRVWVLFDAYEEDLATIEVGDKVEFTTASLPNRTFTTRITFIDPVIDPDTRVASLRGEVDNPKQVLKPEMFVRGTLVSPIAKDEQLLLPKSAVLWTGERSVVYVKVPDANVPSFEFRQVQLGERVGENYLVESGLKAGEEVVTYGNFAIDAAAQLNNQASMMNRQVKVKGMGAPMEQLPDYTDNNPEAFKAQLSALTQAYLSLKDALVATDPDEAASAAQAFQAALKKVDMGLVKGEAHLYWMQQLEALEAHSNAIAETKDVEEQREQFDFLSQALIKTLKAFGVSETTYYVQHCPMAFDDNGADWISDVEEIRNPYFGDKMLKCGLVQETIAAKQD